MNLIVIVGVQKAATTSLHLQLSQHASIKSSLSLKDVDLFGKLYYNKDAIENALSPFNDKEGYVLHTYVNYIMYEQSLLRIVQFNPACKIIVILRDPVDRAISAFNYFVRKGIEHRTMQDALVYKPKSLSDISDCTQENDDFTYIEHGFYGPLMQRVYDVFGKKNVYTLQYTDYINDQNTQVNKVLTWLGLSPFEFTYVKSNQSGVFRFPVINTLIKHGGLLKNIAIKIFVSCFGEEKYADFKHRFYLWNIEKSNKVGYHISEQEVLVRQYLSDLYENS